MTVDLLGYAFNLAGGAVEDATAQVLTKNTTTQIATVDTDSNGKFEFSGIAEGLYDIKVTSGSSVRWRKYDDEIQTAVMEAGSLRLRGTNGSYAHVFQGTPSATRTITFPDEDGTVVLTSTATDITLDDDVDISWGTGADALMRWSDGDADNHALALGLGDTSQQFHITDKAAIATDWARSAGTHPEVAIHSNTTPASDYLAIGNHDGTTASIDVVGGTTLDLRIAGTDELQITAAGIDTNGGTVTGTTITGATALVGGTVSGTTGTFSSTVQGTVITATTGFAPDASDGAYLGTASLQFADLFLADGAVVNLGDDQDVTLTHVADTGVLLNSTRQLQFGDSGTYIHQSADGVLDLVSDTEIEINATTIDINGAVDISGNATIGGNLNVTGTTTTVDTTNTVVKDSLIELNNGAGSNSNDLGVVMERGSTGDNAIIAWDESADGFVVGTTTATGASTGNLTITAAPLVASDITAASLDISGNVDVDGTLEADAYTVNGDALNEYIADTVGAMFTSNTETRITATYQDGDNTIDLEVDDMSGATALDDVATGDAAATLATTVGNITIDAQANNTDIIFKGTYDTGDITMLTLDGSDAGNAIFVNDVQLKSDGALLEFGADLDTVLTHTDGTGLTLNSTNKLTFGDVASFIQQSTDGTLRIDGEAIIDLNASTRVDVSGDLKVGTSVQTATIDYTDGDLAMTIADGGGVTFAQQVSLDKSILVDSTPADTVYSGITGTFTAGEALSVGECVYLKAADTRMWKAVSGAGGTGLITAEIMCVAVAAEAISAGAAGVFLLQGFITSTAFPTYAIGETLYLPEAEQSSLNVPEGAAVDSTGDFVQVLGWASAANTIFFNPDFTIIEHA